MEIKKILAYQDKDKEAIQLEKQLMESDFRKVYTQMLTVLKDEKNKTSLLENEAGDIVFVFDNLKKKYNENVEALDKFFKLDFNKLTEKEINDIYEQVSVILNNINVFEKKLLSLAERVNTTLNEFESTKRKYSQASDKYKTNKSSYESLQTEIEPKLNKINSELKKLEADLPEDIFKIYKSLRQDRIFPILIPLTNKSCGWCRMELPSAAQSKLKVKGYMECEHCHRIIYTVS